MSYSFVADSFHIKNFVDTFFEKVYFYTKKRPVCVLIPLEGLGATHAIRFRLTGKPVVNVLFVVIELFR